MDRASILGDAVEYLKELLERINNLHNELESSPSSTSLSASTSFHPLTPTPLTLPSRVKEELCPSSLPSPNGQPARVNCNILSCTFSLTHAIITSVIDVYAQNFFSFMLHACHYISSCTAKLLLLIVTINFFFQLHVSFEIRCYVIKS